MGFNEVITQLIEAKYNQLEKMIIVSGTVKTLRELDCDVSREGFPDLLGVRLHSTTTPPDNFMRITPKVGSAVLCGIIENDISEAVIISCGEIENVTIQIEDAMLHMSKGKFTIKNKDADLKTILTKSFDQLINAKITTPSGTGFFSPDDKLEFQKQKNNTKNLFH